MQNCHSQSILLGKMNHLCRTNVHIFHKYTLHALIQKMCSLSQSRSEIKIYLYKQPDICTYIYIYVQMYPDLIFLLLHEKYCQQNGFKTLNRKNTQKKTHGSIKNARRLLTHILNKQTNATDSVLISLIY